MLVDVKSLKTIEIINNNTITCYNEVPETQMSLLTFIACLILGI